MHFTAVTGLLNKRFLLLGLLIWLFLALNPSQAAHPPDAVNVLIVHSYNEHIPWNRSFTRGLNSILDSRSAEFNVFREYMDVYRSSSKMSDAEFAEYLRDRYSDMDIDIVVGESDEAADFVAKYQNVFAPEKPTIFFASRSFPQSDHSLAIVPKIPEVLGVGVSYAVEQNPDAKQVLIVQGDNPEAMISSNALQEALRALGGLKIGVAKDFTLDSLLEQIKRFPQSGIIFYTLVFKDQSGQTFSPRAFLGQIARVSKAPIYVNYSALVGNGALGGYVIDGEALARNILEASLAYVLHGRFSSSYQATSDVFDWEVLKQHGIPLSKVPDGATIINRPVGFVETNFTFFVVILLIALAFFGGLIFVAIHLTRKNLELRYLNERLEQAKYSLNHTNAQLNQLAMHDSLTQLYNRRAAMPLVNECLKKVGSTGKMFALMLLDIDHFKMVNDTHGHVTGDTVLKSFAEIVSNLLRNEDVFARWGGEEFLLLIEVHNEGDAQTVAEKIRREVEKTKVGEKNLNVTVSIGATLVASDYTFDKLVRKVDAALYKAKSSGRNRVHFVSEDDA